MTKEQKELLLKDLCTRLPYGVKVHIEYGDIPYGPATVTQIDVKHSKLIFNFAIPIENCKPYLRPMSSMTEKERREIEEITIVNYNEFEGGSTLFDEQGLDYLLSHHLDYRGLIPMGLAIKAPKDMYKI